MSAPAPVVLLTDFGSSDWYVAAMKGEILRRAPGVTLVDLAHSVPPGDVRRAAFLLEQAWRSFPSGAVFLVVVDPEVGSERRPLAVSAGGCRFVGPDNGVLTPALEEPGATAYALDARRVTRRALSATFHGRDLFAPAAALLARGGEPEDLGEPVGDPVRLAPERPLAAAGALVAHVVHVDRFGNCITDVTAGDLRRLLGDADPRALRLRAGRACIRGLARTYADAESGAPLALLGSGGRLEIAVRGGHAGMRLGLAPGSTIEIAIEDGEAGPG